MIGIEFESYYLFRLCTWVLNNYLFFSKSTLAVKNLIHEFFAIKIGNFFDRFLDFEPLT
jgi:hypothetical protein